MRKSFRVIGGRLTAVALASLLLCAGAQAQTSAQDHTIHHPGPNANAPAEGPAPRPSPATTQGGQMGGMMEGGMEGHGATQQPKELYPSLMDLPELSPEKRTEVERAARERMEAGRARLASAAEQLSAAAARGDYKAMEEAAAEAREAAAVFESGLAASRALAEGRPPRGVALEWFRREMNLLPPPAGAEAETGFFGLPSRWFHYFVILVLSAFLGALLWMYFHKMRRAAALLGALTGGAALADTAGAAESNNRTAAPASTAAAPAGTPATGRWSGRLRVARIFDETRDVKTFRLAPPDGGELLPFTFEPGQFLTVSVNVGGEELKRSYSIASSPCCQGWCEITVKHAPGGRVSGYLHAEVREGDLLEVSAPYGRFTFRGREAPHVVFIAGGVGITPLMSSIRYLTDQSWPGEIHLIYACARADAVIFREELEYLRRRHPKLHVTITLSHEESSAWTGPKGYVTKELLLEAVPDIKTRRVHLCGPPPMMDAVKALLAEVGVPAEQVKTELFLSPEPRRDITAAAAAASASPVGTPAQDAQTALCTFARSGKSAPLPPDKTVLEASEDAGVNIDYSCRQGYCGVCRTKLLAGRVTMEVEDGLEPGDKEQNIILACQAKSTGDVTVEA